MLRIPYFKFNLISIHKLCKQLQKSIFFTPNSCLILQGPSVKSPQVIGKDQDDLYILKISQPIVSTNSPINSKFPVNSKLHSFSFSTFLGDVFNACSSCFDSNVKEKLWHYRFSHMPMSNMKNVFLILHLVSSFLLLVLFVLWLDNLSFPFISRNISTTSNFELIHVDTWGPYKHPTHNGFRYFLTIVYDFSRVWHILLAQSPMLLLSFNSFIQMVDRQFNTRVKIIRTDNVFELGSGNLQSELLYTLLNKMVL